MTLRRILLALPVLLSLAGPAPGLTLLGRSVVGTDPKGALQNFGSPNGKSHQLDILLTHRGWQYAAYYNDRSPRRIVMARRNRLVSGSRWETFVFEDYAQTEEDGHNVISLGMCPLDGTLHLAFDHHVSDLNYRRSVPGLLDHPATMPWNAAQFGPVTDRLGGEKVAGVTYPMFATSPAGTLYFSRRLGSPQDGEQILYEYSLDGWNTVGRYIDGAGANPYMDNLIFGPGGRLHAGWIWRQGDLNTAHDICYAYSDDAGRTWHNSAGARAGSTGEGALTRASPGITAVPVARGQMINQEGMTVDLKNRPHLVHRLERTLHHFYREEDGTWQRINTGIASGDRAKILTDAAFNAYILVGGLRIARATQAAGYKDWKLIHDRPERYEGTALHDRYLLARENILSIYLVAGNFGSVEVFDFRLEGHVSGSIRMRSARKGTVPGPPEAEGFHDALGRFGDLCPGRYTFPRPRPAGMPAFD